MHGPGGTELEKDGIPAGAFSWKQVMIKNSTVLPIFNGKPTIPNHFKFADGRQREKSQKSKHYICYNEKQ